MNDRTTTPRAAEGDFERQLRDMNEALLVSSVKQHELTEQAQTAERRYRRLFETAKDGILILDIHTGRITDANPFISELLGCSTDGFLGKELWEIGLFSDKSANEAAARELREKGYFHYDDLPLETSLGQQIEVEVVANIDTEGHQGVVQCNIRDITQRRTTERALEKALIFADDIIATLREPFVVLDGDLRVKTANRSFYDSFHVSKEETENCFVYELGNGQWDIPGLRTLLDRVITCNESVHDFEVEHCFPALGRKTMLLNARPFPPDSKHPELILLAVQDVSVLRHRADELAEAARHKDEFLATLGHELRNPLAPIRTGLELMKLIAHDPAAMEEIRSTMERQSRQMVRLIDDLLDVSRITHGKLELRTARIDLADVVRSAVEAARPFIDEASHELKVTLPPLPILLDADPNRLAQVLSNLLINSTKYTPEGGHIGLIVERRGSDVVVTVKDNGIGIPADLQGRIFEMFAQVDRRTPKAYTGLGIGLMLVKQLVEMHGGTIEVRSGRPHQGSEFCVRLPIAAVAPPVVAPQPTHSEPAARPARLRILVVDDNKAAADMLALLVKMLGNEVRTAYDGSQGVEAAAGFRPNLVLMDIGMPKMNGYEAAKHIREQPWGKNIVLVALTGWGQDEDRQRTKEAGFDHHLVKPAESAALQNLFAKLKPDPVS